MNDDFVLYASSAMDKKVARGVLRGRPFGGVCILVRTNLAACCKLISTSARHLIIKIDETIVCNVYLPCSSVANCEDVYTSTLASIVNCLSDEVHDSVIVGGDFNLQFETGNSKSNMIQDFCDALSIVYTDHLLPASETITYRNSAGTASSLIDHFLVSRHLLSKIDSLNATDNGANLSDHVPLSMHLAIPHHCETQKTRATGDVGNESNLRNTKLPKYFSYHLRWDKMDHQKYYDETFAQLKRIVISS